MIAPDFVGTEARDDQEGSATGAAALHPIPSTFRPAAGRRHARGPGGSLLARPAARRGRQQDCGDDCPERLRRRYLAGAYDPVLPGPVALALSAPASGVGPL